ncbi:valacyclovir hydrolase-like [Aethina tumida]|uniref:valacyclovir hydrolase-like n=1 Tax=Aethina tumida TaxID=116153 RepID=UPI0021471E3A|nr:valacyclovir hydrolase-like [Aethina tumida]
MSPLQQNFKNLIIASAKFKLIYYNFTTANETTVNVDGQKINYLKAGSGDRTLLCFPGALGTIWSDFKPQIENLDKNKFTIIAWDPPGYGGSRPSKGLFKSDFYHKNADVAHDFLKHIGVQKVSLLGWSDGGISSMILSAKYSEIVDKLVIWGSKSYILPEEIKSYEKLRDLSKWSDKMKAPLIKLYTEEGLKELWSGWYNAVKEIYQKGGDICKSDLTNIKCPTFILHGDKDPMLAPEHPNYLLNNIKKSKIHRFPEGKHNIHLRYADEFNKIISDFLLQD